MAEQVQAPPRLVELANMQAAAVEAGAVCTTGLRALDAAMGGGLQPGLTLIVAPQNFGKTTLANQLFCNLRALASMERQGGVVAGDPRNVWSHFLSLDMPPRDLEPMGRAYLSTLYAADRGGYMTADAARLGSLDARQGETSAAIDAALDAPHADLFGGGVSGRVSGEGPFSAYDDDMAAGGWGASGPYGPIVHAIEYAESSPGQREKQREHLALQDALDALADSYDAALGAEAAAFAALDVEARERFGCSIASRGAVQLLDGGTRELSAQAADVQKRAEALAVALERPASKRLTAETREDAEALAASDAVTGCAPLAWLPAWGPDARIPRITSGPSEVEARGVVGGAVYFADYAALLGHAIACARAGEPVEEDAVRDTNRAGAACRDWVNARPARAVVLACQYRGGGAARPFDYDSIMGGSDLVNAAGTIIVLSDESEPLAAEQAEAAEALDVAPMLATATKTRRRRKGGVARLWFDGDHSRFIERE